MRTDEILLKQQAARQLTRSNQVDSNREIITRFLQNQDEEPIELTDKQKELLMRWEYADEKIRAGMGRISRQKIAELIRDHFGVSLNTAKNDMVAAEEVFSSSNPLNKRHRIQLRVEYLERQSRRAAKIGDYKAVGAIEKSLSFYLDKYPETVTAKPRRQVTYNLQVNNFQNATIPEQEAEAIIMQEFERIELEQEND